MMRRLESIVRSHWFASALAGLLAWPSASSPAAEIRYNFELVEFRESMSLFAPLERMTGFYHADVDYATGALNNFIAGLVQLHEGGPIINDGVSVQNFGTWEFYGPAAGTALDWTGGVNDFLTGFDISAGGVLNPRFRQGGTSYTTASLDGIWVHDGQNGSSSIHVTVPEDQMVTVGSADRTYQQDQPLTLGRNSWMEIISRNAAEVRNHLRTNGGGIRSSTGFKIGRQESRTSGLDWWFGSDLRQMTAFPLQQQASQMQAPNIFTQMGAERPKQQTQRWQLNSDLQSTIYQITRQVNVNKAKMADRIHNGILQYLSLSTIDGDVDFLGHLVVGGDPAVDGFDTTTVLGDFTTQPLSIFDFDLGERGHDQIVVDGAVHLGELNFFNLNLADDGLGRYVPQYADLFDLIVADQITTDGAIPQFDEHMPDDLTMFLGIVDLPGGQQALRAFTGVNTIPEPGTAMLLLAALAASGLLPRRRNLNA